MAPEKLKEHLDGLWSAFPEIKEGIRVINKEDYDRLCKTIMKVGQLIACSDMQKSLSEYVENI